MSTAKLFSKEQRLSIVDAIKAAEKKTSGEIRVHIEGKCRGEATHRAVRWFHQLRMDNTQARNGVLIYLAVHSRKFAIIGDEGINKVVPEGFWDNVAKRMQEAFTSGQFVEGIMLGISETGRLLKQYFPYTTDDINEQPDDISFGN